MVSRTILLRQIELDELVDSIASEVIERLRPMLDEQPEFVTTKELAGKMRVSVPTIDRMRRDGFITPIKIRGRTLYSLSDTIASLKSVNKGGAADD